MHVLRARRTWSVLQPFGLPQLLHVSQARWAWGLLLVLVLLLLRLPRTRWTRSVQQPCVPLQLLLHVHVHVLQLVHKLWAHWTKSGVQQPCVPL
jgi:hypothetical protein